MSKYQVIVGNVGIVYSGSHYDKAMHAFTVYQHQSESEVGRASGENITLMCNDEIEREYIGSIERTFWGQNDV